MDTKSYKDSWIWPAEFKRRMRDVAQNVLDRGWRLTIPALAEVSELNDKRIRSRLNYHPKFKAELGVVPSLKTGRNAAAERRQS